MSKHLALVYDVVCTICKKFFGYAGEKNIPFVCTKCSNVGEK